MTTHIWQAINSFGLTDIWSLEQRQDNGKWLVKKNDILWASFDHKVDALGYINKICKKEKGE